MRSLRVTAMLGALVVGVCATVVALAGPASAATVCDQWGIAQAGNYIVQNNRWGTSATQCVSTTNDGFSITQQDGVGNLSGAPASYPSIFLGCHNGNCSTGMPVPKQVSAITSATSSINYTYVSSGTWDAAYDIWMNPTPATNGVMQTEIMIWFNHTGSISPVGSAGGSATVGGKSWTVWTGNNGQNNVVSYVSNSAISSWSFSVLDFLKDTINRGYATTAWYLTSIQAGFEPWVGGVGLGISGFTASVVTGGTTTTTTTTTTTKPVTTTTTTRSTTTTTKPVTTTTTKPVTTTTTRATSTTGGVSTCSAAYVLNSAWQGGFQSTVNVTANGAINGWKVTLNLPSGTTLTNIWSGVNTGTTGAVSVANLGYNGKLAAGTSTSFGFQGTGSGSGVTVSCTAS